MKRLTVGLFVLLALCACASTTATTAAPGGSDSLIGHWDGVGAMQSFHAQFGADHLYEISESGSGDIIKGTWQAEAGKYALAHPEDPRHAIISSDGELRITADINPAIAMYFRRKGAKPPVVNPGGPAPHGEWRFAYTNKSAVEANLPAPFDIMIFGDSGKVHLHSSANAKDFDYPFSISGNTLSIPIPGGPVPNFKLEFTFRYTDNGNSLLLAAAAQQHGPFETEWTFKRPENFVKEDLSGVWIGEDGEVGKPEMEFLADGSWTETMHQKNGRDIVVNLPAHPNYYRLWKAPFGNAMTMEIFNPSMSMQSTRLVRYERKGDTLELTPIEATPDGTLKLHEEAKSTLKLKE